MADRGRQFRAAGREEPAGTEASSGAATSSGVQARPRRRANILLVEDDPLCRRVMQRLLAEHDVTACASAEDALTHHGPFDLVLTDMVLGGADGAELIAELRRRGVRAPVVVMSGFGEIAVEGASAALRKPVRRAELIATVDAMLAERAETKRSTG